MPLYADIILPLATPAPYTYLVPEGMAAAVGSRVTVALGKSRAYTGVVAKIHEEQPSKGTPRPITRLVDAHPLVTARQIGLWQWIADYYMAPIGEVIRQGLPSGIRNDRFAPPAAPAFQLAPEFASEEGVNRAFGLLKRSPAGSKALTAYLESLPVDRDGNPLVGNAPFVQRAAITANAGISTQAAVQLCLKGIFLQEQIPVSEFADTAPVPVNGYVPSAQETVLVEAIAGKFADNDTVLLHESGYLDKKELYCALAERYLKDGGQMLILQPDIASAISLAAKLEKVFKEGQVSLLHSRMTDHARSSLYYGMATGTGRSSIVVGTRGALFLPFDDLRLIVAESEQSSGYKQTENAPRYNARDVAAVIAREFGARFLLTSEAPSMESYHNASAGKWGVLATSDKTTKGALPPPKFTVIERGKGLISKYLKKRAAEELDAGHQVLVFQNRRGFSSYVECPECFHSPVCANCNVTLTYHKSGGSLVCHYCGYSLPYSPRCPACGSHSMNLHGIGTENIEEQLEELFPEAGIARLDYDTTRRTGDFMSIAEGFADSRSRILVGTQMIVNGIDFSNVSLVAIANADNILSATDFRTSERAFQLLTQLSNRIGDKARQGEVIIQTSRRLDPVIISVANRDSAGFYETELQQRHQMKYPPAVRMITFAFRHSNRRTVQEAAAAFDGLMRPVFGSRLSPGFEPPVDRTRGQYIIETMLRIERSRSAAKAKKIAAEAVAQIRRKFPSAALAIDVDPIG